jgi:hypothetical protein
MRSKNGEGKGKYAELVGAFSLDNMLLRFQIWRFLPLSGGIERSMGLAS